MSSVIWRTFCLDRKVLSTEYKGRVTRIVSCHLWVALVTVPLSGNRELSWCQLCLHERMALPGFKWSPLMVAFYHRKSDDLTNYSPLFSTLRSSQHARHFADDISKRIFLNGNIKLTLKVSLKFVPKFRINNVPALVQIIAWRRPGDKPLSEPMMDSLLTHICVTRPQWVDN